MHFCPLIHNEGIRSFEERLAALVKPTPVPEPNQDQVNDKLSKLNAQIEKCDKRLVSGNGLQAR
jgi:hypothetical protein